MNKTGENPCPGSLPLVILPLQVWNEGPWGTFFSIDLCLYLYPRFLKLGFPGGSVGKESACDAGDTGLIPELGRYPGEGNGNPLQYSCLENSMDRGAWVGYSPWGHKESDTTERLTEFKLVRHTAVLGFFSVN